MEGKRIAVCISGRCPDTFDHLSPHLITPLSTLGQVDLFFSLWMDENGNTNHIDANSIRKKYPNSSVQFDRYDYEHFRKRYHIEWMNRATNSTSEDAAMKWWKVFRCYEMVFQPKEYDLIIAVDSMLKFNGPICLLDVRKALRDEWLLFFPENQHPEYEYLHEGYNSDLAFGSPSTMEIYSRLIIHIPEITSSISHYLPECYLAGLMAQNRGIETRTTSLRYDMIFPLFC